MQRKGWYLVAYDIADPKRLIRVHKLLKQEGMAAQRSVFFVQGTEDRMNRLLDRMAAVSHLKEDDLRAYPIVHPRKVWTNGFNPLADFPVLSFESETKRRERATRKENRRKWCLKRIVGL